MILNAEGSPQLAPGSFLYIYYFYTFFVVTSIFVEGAKPVEVDPSGSYSGRKRRQSADDYDEYVYEQTETGKDVLHFIN